MIIESFRRISCERGSLLLFTPEKALLVVMALKQAQIHVLGLDAFKLTDNTTQPVMEQSIDFSETLENSWEKAEQFLTERKDRGLFFEVVADD